MGKCSLTVALPVLSCCGGGDQRAAHGGALHPHRRLTGFTYRDLTGDILPMARHWKSLGCRFRRCTRALFGQRGANRLVAVKMFDWFGGEDTLILVDPVMGDGGKLYQTYTPQMADGMARLCRRADIVVPNMTEACHLLGRPYNPGPYTQGENEEILQGLCAMGPKMAVLTGVWLQEGALGTACYDSQVGEAKLFLTDRIEGFYHGTGDLFASALLGGLLNGAPLGGGLRPGHGVHLAHH